MLSSAKLCDWIAAPLVWYVAVCLELCTIAASATRRQQALEGDLARRLVPR